MRDRTKKIAIIGGGLSGLLIAEGLIRQGYKNVSLFEQGYQLGGKLHSIEYKGRSHELGAIFGLPSYMNLRELMDRLKIKADGPKLTRTCYNTRGVKIMPLPKEDLPGFLDEIKRLPEISSGYKGLKNPNFDGVEEILMEPFSKWCDYHGFKVLKTIYTHYFTIFGLGSIEEVPAVYVLKIMSYEHLMDFMGIPQFFTWKQGVSQIAWELARMVPDIRLGQKIVNISKLPEGGLTIKTAYECLDFDQVVMACPLEQFSNLDIWDEKTRYFLDKIKYQDFNTYGFIVDRVPRGCGCILENLSPQRKGHITIWDARWEEGVGSQGLVVLYAYDPPKESKISRLDLIKADLDELGVGQARLYQARHWKHHPYVDSQTLKEGFYEKINQIQGRDGIFLTGEIVSGLSIENAIWHSKYLLEEFFF